MTCTICKYDWCWTCGLSKRSIFHKIQLSTEETGFVCVIINELTTSGSNCLILRYVAVVLTCTVGPPLFLALAAAAAAVSAPFYALGMALDYVLIKPCKRQQLMNKPCCCLFLSPVIFFSVIIAFVALLALAAVAYPFALAAGCLLVVLFYLVDFFLLFLVLYV